MLKLLLFLLDKLRNRSQPSTEIHIEVVNVQQKIIVAENKPKRQ